MQNNNSQNQDQAPINTTPEAVTSFQIDVPQLPLHRMNPDVPGVYLINMDEMIASPIDYLARALGFYWDRGAYHGANPLETGATDDGFTLWPGGNAKDRKLPKTYSTEQMLALAEKKGISPTMEGTLHKISDFRRGMEKDSRSGSSKNASSKAASLPPFRWDTAYTRTWSYFDENGVELFQVGRYDSAQGKAIRQRHRAENGGWIHNLDNVRRVLYNLRGVMNARTVLFVEGEKAADILNGRLLTAGRLGEMVATTTSMGAGNAHKTEFGDVVAAKTVVIFPDNDEVGKRHGNDVCGLCAAAAAVKRVTLPGLPEKGDVADYFAAGGTIEEVLSLIENAPLWDSSQVAQPRGIQSEGASPYEFPSAASSHASSNAAPPQEAAAATDNGSAPVLKFSQEATTNASAGRQEQFKFWTLAEVLRWPEPKWLIQDFLVESTTSLLTGKHASFKSFIALDMALCVATGRPWHKFGVRQGNVVYIAAEGASGVKKRAGAWLERHGVKPEPENIWFLDMPILLADDAISAAFAARLQALAPSLVVVDTLARCAVDLEENSSRDMGKLVRGIDHIVRKSRAHVLIVHHNNKAGTHRGSTAVPAAVDTHFAVERKGKSAVLSTEKQKDAEEAKPLNFEIEGVDFQDALNPNLILESVVLTRTDVVMDPGHGVLTSLENQALQCLIDAFANEGATAFAWAQACKVAEILDSNPRRTRRNLVGKGAVTMKSKSGESLDQALFAQLSDDAQKAVRFYPAPGFFGGSIRDFLGTPGPGTAPQTSPPKASPDQSRKAGPEAGTQERSGNASAPEGAASNPATGKESVEDSMEQFQRASREFEDLLGSMGAETPKTPQGAPGNGQDSVAPPETVPESAENAQQPEAQVSTASEGNASEGNAFADTEEDAGMSSDT